MKRFIAVFALLAVASVVSAQVPIAMQPQGVYLVGSTGTGYRPNIGVGPVATNNAIAMKPILPVQIGAPPFAVMNRGFGIQSPWGRSPMPGVVTGSGFGSMR